MPEYNPPILNRQITIRNPEDEPTIPEDDIGNPLGQLPEWGFVVWASRRDQAPFTEIAEAVQIRAGRSVFTIRHRAGISPNALILDSDGTPFILAGNPVERGGVTGEMFERYLELHCERRTGLETS